MQKLNLPIYSIKLKKEGNKTLVFDPIRKKRIVLTPEEWVRQNFIQFLIQEKNYPASLMAVEMEINLLNTKKRCEKCPRGARGPGGPWRPPILSRGTALRCSTSGTFYTGLWGSLESCAVQLPRHQQASEPRGQDITWLIEAWKPCQRTLPSHRATWAT